MRLAVFGATGRTGRLLVARALERGHEVAAYARDPGRLGFEAPGLRAWKGEIQDARAIEAFLEGAEAVISLLGPRGRSPGRPISRGYEAILGAMGRLGARRLIMTAGAGVGDPLDRPRPLDRLFGLALRLAAPQVLADMREAAALLRSSGLDWSLVRLPRLTDGPAGGGLRVGYLGPGMGTRVARAEVADFLLDEAESPRWIRASPCISSRRGP